MLDENLKHSEEKSRGFTKLPREFALLSAKWCYCQPPWHGQRFCRLGLWIDVTIFQVDLIWAVFCKKKDPFGLVVDTGCYSAVTHLMRFFYLKCRMKGKPDISSFLDHKQNGKQGEVSRSLRVIFMCACPKDLREWLGFYDTNLLALFVTKALWNKIKISGLQILSPSH